MQSSQRDERQSITKRKEIPYQPPQVSLADLDAQGRLIPEKTCRIIQKKILSKTNRLKKLGIDPKTGGKLCKKILRTVFGINTDFSLLITNQNNELKAFAIYRGEKKNKHLGKGSMGVVKVVQDIDTGTFYAAKYQTEKTPESDLRTAASREAHQLHIAGQLIGNTSFESPNRPNRRTHVIMMPLHPGVESRLLISQHKTPMQILEMCCAISDAVRDIHGRGVLHRDLKTENIIYDLINSKVGVIDYGHATLGSANLKVPASKLYGTPLYMPPETFAKYLEWKQDNNIKFKVTYTDKTDIYCLGLAFARFFRLVRRVGVDDLARCIILDPEEDSELIAKTSPIPGELSRNDIINFLRRMTAPLPKDRPSIEEVRKFFQEMRNEIRNQPGNTINCAVIAIEDYEKLQGSAKREFIEKLLPFDQIQLANCSGEPDIAAVARIHTQLSSHGVAVRSGLIYHAVNLQEAKQELSKNVASSHIQTTFHTLHPDRFDHSARKGSNPTQIISPPSQVDEQDLGPDNRLISAKMLYDLKEVLESELESIRQGEAIRISKSDIISKYGIKCPYSIVAHRNSSDEIELFAIYRGARENKQLGAGQHGAIKLIQNLETSEFHALKLTAAFANEDQLLQESGDLVAKYSYEPRSKRNRVKYAPKHGNAPPTINAMITRLAKGITLDNIPIDNPAQLCKVLLGMVNATKQLHDKNILHNDLKPDQFLFDETNNIVKLVDLGNSYNFGDHAVLKRLRGKSFRYGTEFYSCKHTPHVDVSDTESPQNLLKVDIYALGISMAQVAGLIDQNYNLVALNSKAFHANEFIPDDQLRELLWELLHSMTIENKNHRPSIDKVLQTCNVIAEQINNAYAASESIGLIDFNKFKACSEDQRQKLAHSASSLDSVLFMVHEDETVDSLDLAEAKKELETAGVKVKDQVISLPSTTEDDILRRKTSEGLLEQLQSSPGMNTRITILDTQPLKSSLPSVSGLMSSLFKRGHTQSAPDIRRKKASNDDKFDPSDDQKRKGIN